ncbi:MAG: fused MFS/spermidine synthase [Candidatus Melainabacteria bacterium]|nr:fused MFS/spermidine synthase [Candidatus Melainabacteria bacterium]
MPGSGRKTIEVALLLSVALSGGAALIAQSVWQRELLRLVGATTPASAVVYAGVMAGLGAGALLGNALLTRGGGPLGALNPLRFFAMLEVLTCACAFAYAFVFSGGVLFQMSCLGDESTRLALAFLIALLPSLFMGATWPAAVAAAERIALDLDSAIVSLYTANLLGAVVGAAGGAFLLIPTGGLSLSLGVSGGVNIVSGVTALVLSFAAVKLICPRNSIEIAASKAPDTVVPQIDCALVFLSAAATLALEVTLTRLFTLVVGSSTYSVATVLVGALLGIYWSAQMVGLSAKNIADAKTGVALFASGAAVVIFTEACLLNYMPEMVYHFSQNAAGLQNVSTLNSFVIARAMVCMLFVVIPVFFVSAVFPMILAGSLKEVYSKTTRAGWLYVASTLGCVVGSLGAGLFLIPGLSEKFESGLLTSLIVVAAVCLFIAALAAAFQIMVEPKKAKISGVAFLSCSAIIGLLAVVYSPHADKFMLSQGLGLTPVSGGEKSELASLAEARKNSPIVFYREGLNTTVTVQDFPKHNVRVLKNDGKAEAAIPLNLARPAPTSDYTTQILLACLPYVLSSKEKKNCLVIGCGSGITYGAIAEQKNIASLTVAEIEKAVFEASRFFLPQQKNKERADIRKLICDARSQLAFGPETYDLIVSQPAEPWVNGAADLYTKEFFQLAFSRLNKGGVFCQWLQLYAIDEKMLLVLLNTIQSAFPSTYVFHPHGSGEILIVAVKSETSDRKHQDQPIEEIAEEAKLDMRGIKAAMGEAALSAKLQYCRIISVPDLLSMLVLTPQSLDELLWKKLGSQRVLFNTDDNLRSEYALPYQLLDKDDGIEKNLAVLYSSRANLLPCFKNIPNSVGERAEFLDRVALSMAAFSQKHPAESLDDAALAAAYEAWTLSESQATAAACDVIAYMTGRFNTARQVVQPPLKLEAMTQGQCFWVGQAEALKGNKDRAIEVFSQGVRKGGPQTQELTKLLNGLKPSTASEGLPKTAEDCKTSVEVTRH